MPAMLVRPYNSFPAVGSIAVLLVLCLCSISAAAEDPLPASGDSSAGEAADSGPVLDPAAIELSGATIGKITIRNRNIFDLNNPLEDKWLYRTANKLHIVTKPHVIRSQLLFVEGDAYSTRLSEESERLLRFNSYIDEADIKPVHNESGIVDLEVTTTDVWTLSPDISLGRSGGENHLGIGLFEQNLFGRGIQLGGKYETDVDRDTLSFVYTDNNFLSDRYRIAANIAETSDGFFRSFEFAKPFYALDRRRAGRAAFFSGEQIDKLYDRGDVVAEFNHRFDYLEASLGRSRGLRNGWVRRYSAGVAYSRNKFGAVPGSPFPLIRVPQDREFLYPFINFELIEDQFEKTANFDNINRTEDRFVGTFLNARIGYSDEGTASSDNAWHYQARFANSLLTTDKTSLTIGANVSGRWQNGEARNNAISGAIRFHRRISKNQLFYASLSGTSGTNLDIDNPLVLGGETGLRGYPLRYQDGDSKVLLTLEQRLFTNWYPFRLAHVGAALFFDVGRTWGDSPVGAPNLGILKDVGFGLRLGNVHAANSPVVHIDIAFPLDGENDIDSVQILIDTKRSF